MEENKETTSLNFIEEFIEEDIANDRYQGRIQTRFPPEPNGYLHIGHTKAICINFLTAKKYGGKTNLRFDDTNPVTEDTEYVEAIKKDIEWLGFEWDGEALFASDYFDQLYTYAEELIQKGCAYVDDSTSEQMAELKGTPTEPGIDSSYRDRSIEENLKLFRGMKAGEYEDGSRVLRAKIDMKSPNMLMRDPIIYRIKTATHHRTGDKWCIYPMYDFAHGQSDSIENITHSLCSLEFRHHRPVYNWFIEKLGIYPSRQIEFSRMNVGYMITSKRKLLKLVEEGTVTSWDDPRMPTLAGMRRRGYPPAALRAFIEKVGVTKRENLIDISLLEHAVREELNKTAPRVMAVLDPIKLTIRNYPEGESENLVAINNPEDESQGTREIPFSRDLFIERSDFKIDAPKKFFRLGPDKKVRLKNAYIIHCVDHVVNEAGEVEEIICDYFPNSKSGEDNSGIKAKGVLHWVSIPHAHKAEVRQYDRLFSDPTPTDHEDRDFSEFINKDSFHLLSNVYIEPTLASAKPGDFFQFMRTGYFKVDQDSTAEHIVFNRTITLKDAWAKMNKK